MSEQQIAQRRKEAAKRALKEAHMRAAQQDGNGPHRQSPASTELGGRGGPEPTRYGDWEKKGIAVDF